MSDNLIERAELLLREDFDPQPVRYTGARGLIRELVTALKTSVAQVRYLELCITEEVGQLTPEQVTELERLRNEFV